ncbi:CGGC domain-containing protein [Helicovermis profundi]|uniref:CGGC domain-containing protein n=1 Tax=Helicovermis profundi TaxID=3065157 RepID=A0AAU9E577_9FIRM|nr:hypothetical protein HLPR_07840 [Clostridia bacterium S502]
MKNIAIYVCGEVSKKCTANGCLRAFNNKSESFERYGGEKIQLVSFNNCPGCDELPIENLTKKIEKFKKAKVDVVHLSTCIRGRCEYYEDFAKLLSKEFEVIGYTHGSRNGKKNNNIDIYKSKI